jgi:hypothetical protein
MLGSAPVCCGVCLIGKSQQDDSNMQSIRTLPKWVRVYVWKHTSLLSGVYVAPRDATAKTTTGTRTDMGQAIRERQPLS